MLNATNKVLQLTSHLEPDRVIGAMHALCLVEVRKVAYVEVASEKTISTSSGVVYQLPSVISLKRYINLRKRRNDSGKKRLRIFIRDKFRCQYCAERFSGAALTLDHIMPQSRGGSDDPENLATSCWPCNQRKKDRTPAEARMPLIAIPSALRYGLDLALMEHYTVERPEWRPYLLPWIKAA